MAARRSFASSGPDGKHLSVAAIYTLWTSPDGKQSLYTMSFLMRPASSYVMDNGHHRQPFFISEHGLDAWMKPGKRPSADSKAILREYADEPELEYEVASEVNPSWTSRQRDNEKRKTNR